VLSRPEMSNDPPRSRAPKRPWYLVAALVAGWVLGANGMWDGCNAVAFYKSEKIDVETPAQSINDSAARAKVIALNQRFVATLDAARNRLLPIGIASLLLGAAMVMFSWRAMSGRPGSRGVLVQVTLVRTALVIGGYFLTPDVRNAQLELGRESFFAIQREEQSDKQAEEQGERIMLAISKVLPPVQLAFSVLTAVFVIVALTRPRSRQFFEAAPGSFSEP
jgi:hypothetical protein